MYLGMKIHLLRNVWQSHKGNPWGFKFQDAECIQSVYIRVIWIIKSSKRRSFDLSDFISFVLFILNDVLLPYSLYCDSLFICTLRRGNIHQVEREQICLYTSIYFICTLKKRRFPSDNRGADSSIH